MNYTGEVAQRSAIAHAMYEVPMVLELVPLVMRGEREEAQGYPFVINESSLAVNHQTWRPGPGYGRLDERVVGRVLDVLRAVPALLRAVTEGDWSRAEEIASVLDIDILRDAYFQLFPGTRGALTSRVPN